MDPRLQFFLLDEFRCVVLPRATTVDDVELLRGAHEPTLQRSQDIKHPMKRAEFLRGRWLLRKDPLLAGQDVSVFPEGDIHWPAKVCGSLSHHRGHLAVLVRAPTSSLVSVGLDLERTTIRDEVLERVATNEERTLCDAVVEPAESGGLLFSLKEAVFKALFPVGRQMFWFEACRVLAVQKDKDLLRIKVQLNAAACGVDMNVHTCQVLARLIHLEDERLWLTVASLHHRAT